MIGFNKSFGWVNKANSGVLKPPAQDELIQWLYDYSGDFELLDKVDPLRVTAPDVVGVNVLELNGTDQNIEFLDSEQFEIGSNIFYWSAYIKTTDTSAFLYSKASSGGDFSYAIRIVDGTMTFSATSNGSTILSYASAAVVSDGLWHKVVLIKMLDKVHIYVDDSDVAAVGSTPTSIYNNTAKVEIGSTYNGTTAFYGGRLHEVKHRYKGNKAPVIICAGQSNMMSNSGAAAPAYLQKTQVHLLGENIANGVQQVNLEELTGVNAYWGPELSAGVHIVNAGERPVIFIKVASGATSLAVDWTKGGQQYNNLVTQISDTIAAVTSAGLTPVFEQMWWLQGESDGTNESWANAYYDNFLQFRSDFLSDTGIDVPVVIARIAYHSTPATWPYVGTVRTAQENLSLLDDVSIFSTDDAPKKPADGAHYNAEGVVLIGQRFAENYLEQFSDNGFTDVSLLPCVNQECNNVINGMPQPSSSSATVVKDDDINRSYNLRYGYTPAIAFDNNSWFDTLRPPETDSELEFWYEVKSTDMQSIGGARIQFRDNTCNIFYLNDGQIRFDFGIEQAIATGSFPVGSMLKLVINKNNGKINGTNVVSFDGTGTVSIPFNAFIGAVNTSDTEVTLPTDGCIHRYIHRINGVVVDDYSPLVGSGEFINSDGTILDNKGAGTTYATTIPPLAEDVNGIRLDAKYGLPIAVQGSVEGEREHNGCEVGFRATGAWFSDPANTPNVYHDGTNPVDRYYSDMIAHPNGKYGMYQKSEKDTGTLEMCILKEDGQYPTDWPPTPAQYTQGLKYWTVCSSFADPLVPYPINSGDGIGPDGGWYPIDGDKVYLVEDV